MRGETHGGNKLRTYETFKSTHGTEPYVRIVAQKKFRSAYAKSRLEVASINIKLCRYGLARIPVEERVCSHCNKVEVESHVLLLLYICIHSKHGMSTISNAIQRIYIL